MATILVVDDDPTLRRWLMVTVGLEHDVDEASDGAEAIRRLGETPPDLLLLDMAIRVMDGLKVCRAARSDPSLHQLGIIVLSTYRRREEALAAGADDYFS